MAISEQTFFLDPEFDGPLQKQLQQIVTEGILSGRFRPGDRLPSSRGLARHLGISRITVTLSYTELLANDFLTSRGRSGYFVSENAPRPSSFDLDKRDRTDHVDWSRALGRRFAGPSSLTRPTDWRKYRYPFIYGQADDSLFDLQNWRLCAVQGLGKREFETLTADSYDRDDPQLINYIIRHILPRRGIAARPDEVLLTLGAQNALWMTSQILLTQRRKAAFEQPCYPELREILNQTRCNTCAIPVDEQGLPPDALPKGLNVVFSTPSHHCPTNATMPIDRRRALLERAEAEEFLVVEDDYEFEIALSRAHAPALKSLDRQGRVIYLGSFSKSIFPGLRLGYLVGPPPFIHEARALRSLVLRHPPGHIQRTAANFLSLGHYDAQVRRMATAYEKRRSVMEKALQEHGLLLSGEDRTGGSSFWMRAPDGVNTRNLAQRLQEDSVLIEPGEAFFGTETPDTQHYRLAYSSIPADRIPEGIALVAKRLNDMLAQRLHEG